MWTLAFKKGVNLIPQDMRPPVRLSASCDERLLRFELSSAFRSQIHIDLLPVWNDSILHPYGVMFLTISLLPLARFLWLGRSSRPRSAFAQRADLEPRIPSFCRRRRQGQLWCS